MGSPTARATWITGILKLVADTIASKAMCGHQSAAVVILLLFKWAKETLV